MHIRCTYNMASRIDFTPKKHLPIALKSAIAAGLFLGMPAGLLLWLILLRQIHPSAKLQQLIEYLQENGLYSIYILVFCSVMWSYLLARISGYRPWWKAGLGTAMAFLIGWYSPLSNMDAWLPESTPIHLMYATAMCGIVFSATTSVGLAYGIILRNRRAALTMAFTTGIVSVLTLLLSICLFDLFGIRVGGTVPLAMPKVTAVSLLGSALTGGAVLGVGFSWFVENAVRDE